MSLKLRTNNLIASPASGRQRSSFSFSSFDVSVIVKYALIFCLQLQSLCYFVYGDDALPRKSLCRTAVATSLNAFR